jgi:hypothetical protein
LDEIGIMASMIFIYFSEIDEESFYALGEEGMLGNREEALEIRAMGEGCEAGREEIFEAERGPELGGLADIFEGGKGAVVQDGTVEFGWEVVHFGGVDEMG